MKKKIVICIILLAVLLSSYYIYRGINGKEALWALKEGIKETFNKREQVVRKIPADAESGDNNIVSEEKRGEGGQEKPVPAAPLSEDLEKARTEALEKTGSKEYFIQAGSWRNHTYAREKLKEIKKSYPDAYIFEDDNFSKVRIPNITNKEEGAHVITKIKEDFNLAPLLVLKTEAEHPVDKIEEQKEVTMPEDRVEEPVRQEKIVKLAGPSQKAGDKKDEISVAKDREDPAERAVSVPSEAPPSETATVENAPPLYIESPPVEIKEGKEPALSEDTIEEPIEKKEEALAEEPPGIAEETGEVLPLEKAIAGPGGTGEMAAGEQLSEKTEGKVEVPPNGVIVPPVDTPLPIFTEPPSFGIKEEKEVMVSEDTIEEPIEKKEEALAEEPSGIAEETGEVIPFEKAIAGPGGTGEIAAGEQLSEKTEGKVEVPPNGVIVPPVDTPLPIFATSPSLEIKEGKEAAPSEETIEEPIKKKQEALPEEPSGITEDAGEVLPVKGKIPDVSELNGIAEKTTPHGEVYSEGAIQPLEKEVISSVEKKEGIQTEGTPLEAEKGRDIAVPDGVSITPATPALKPVPVLPLLPTVDMSGEQKDVVTERDQERQEPEEQIRASAEKELSEERVQEEETMPGEEITGEPVRRMQVLRKDISPQEYNRRVVIFPFENLSDDKDVMKHVLPILLEKMEKKGMTVVDEDSLNNFLCQKRIRDTGYISGDIARTIKEEFYASKILTGSIISFSDEENPRFGILARLIDASEGTILWADYAVATGEDFITILNLGRLNTVFSVIPRVMDMLFASFVSEARPGEAKTLHRIGVMPFKNNSSFKNAGIIAMHMFVIELLKSPEFRPIEYGDVRNEIIRLRIWSKGELNYQNINTLSHELDARGILVGIVDDYTKGADLSSPPLVGITVRLVNGRNNKILWYNSDQSNGEENLIALDWGRMRSVHTVAYEVVSNLVGRMGTVKWE